MPLVAVVCGGRDYGDAERVRQVLDEVAPTFVLQGGASGADRLARGWCEARGVDFAEVPALWEARGRAAGPRRNAVQARLAQQLAPGAWVLVAFPGGRGTASMVRVARRYGVRVVQA